MEKFFIIIGLYLILAVVVSIFSIAIAVVTKGEFSKDCVKAGIGCGLVTPIIFLPAMIAAVL